MVGPMSAAATNRLLAVEAVRWALAHGVAEVVLCAGARNLPLVAAWLGVPSVRLWHHPEERSAAFFALGRIQAGAGPVAVVVTSGTAAAELLPAAIEGHLQGLPLLLLTADRPRQFRGSAAPQTIVQPGLFGAYAPTLADASCAAELAPARWDRDDPAHLNLCFDEPLLAGLEDWGGSAMPGALADPQGPVVDWDGFGQDGRLVVAVGKLEPAERDPVAGFLRALGAPVWVESTSGLWGDPRLDRLWVRDGERVLAAGATHVLRLGGVPCGRFWRDLEARPDVRVRSVSRQGWRGLGREAEAVKAGLECLRDWRPQPSPALAAWTRIARENQPSAPAAGAGPEMLTERVLYGEIARRVAPGARVFLGNSLPVRLWQAQAPWRPGPVCYANRGANGIDGEVSAFLGVAEGADEAWGVFGDLTALYDLAAPWVVRQMTPSRLRIVVVNNRGGGIFARLPAVAAASPAARRVVCNAHDLSFRAWAALWGFAYREGRRPADLDGLPDEPVVIEVLPCP